MKREREQEEKKQKKEQERENKRKEREEEKEKIRDAKKVKLAWLHMHACMHHALVPMSPCSSTFCN